ncbi:ROK family protein [Streptomyces sp. NPDC058371]|uniref:ROK family protein n=1 Tax=Streptomyces sp. NPDC058371 TaxID=3346463 RepID=UPI0036686002
MTARATVEAGPGADAAGRTTTSPAPNSRAGDRAAEEPSGATAAGDHVAPSVGPPATAQAARPTPPDFPSPAATATLAADVGGTWVRLRVGGAGAGFERVPAPSRLRQPGRAVEELRRDMVELLGGAAPPGARAAVSFGAAIDHVTGVVHGSAPLWGSATEPYDLMAALRARRPDVTWTLVNDVTAALADFAAGHARPGTRRVGYLTVSSGIGLRIADLERSVIPVDEWGLQGEVGHLTVACPPELAGLECECGSTGHLASLGAGPGFVRVAERLGLSDAANVTRWLPDALDAGEPAARRLLGLCVEPVAELIRTLWCLDPHLDLLGLGGGVVEGLGGHYATELRQRLATPTSYAARGYSTARLDDRLVLCGPGEVDPLRGAERFDQWPPKVAP